MTKSEKTAAPETDAPLESPDVATALIVKIIVGTFAFLALTIAGVWFFYAATVTRPTRPDPTLLAMPRLQTSNGGAELEELQAKEKQQLTTYGWVDRERGLIRIPIDRAMAQIVTRGAGGYGPAEAGAADKAPSP